MITQYTGESLQSPAKILREGQKSETIQPYKPAPELVYAVNLAILLKRPLLLMGEPGGGKSKLAQAVAFELYHRINQNGKIEQDYQDFYQEWSIKSSSKAKEGLYEFDAIRRLGDAQILKKESDRSYLYNKENYIDYRPLGKSILGSTSSDKRVVLLIDEIDKADIDFPNDLLNELDQSSFYVNETQKTFKAVEPPIVFITSNGEKPLSDAFLRRCLFHFIKPLDGEFLKEIIRRRFYDGTPSEMAESLLQKAVDKFLIIRKELENKRMTLGKTVSTSELLDWYTAIKYYDNLKTANNIEDLHLKHLIQDLNHLGLETQMVPYPQILFKNWQSLANFDIKNQPVQPLPPFSE